MNVNEIILKELETIQNPDDGSPDPMKSDEKRFSVSYGMFKDFTVRLKKNQDFAIVGNYVKKQFTSSNHPNKQKAFGNYFYDLNFGSILKTQYVLKIAEPALTAIQAVPDINIMSNVSLQIGQAVKDASANVQSTIAYVQTETEAGKANHNVPDDSDYIGNKMEELKELANANPGDDKDKLRALGVLFSRYYGSLIRDPKEILEKAKRVAGIKKSSTEEVGKEFEEMVINDPTNPAILNFLREGLEKPSEDEIQKGTEALNAFKGAKKPGKKEMRDAYFKLIGSLNYHIKTGFKLFKSEQADAIAELYEKEMKENLFEKITVEIANNKLDKQGWEESQWASAAGFLKGLKEYIKIEKEQGEIAAEDDKAQQQNRWKERYKEFKFVAGQPEDVGVDNVQKYYKRSLVAYNKDLFKEANDILNKIESDTLDGDGWKEIRKKIAKRKYNELDTLYREFIKIMGKKEEDVERFMNEKHSGFMELRYAYGSASDLPEKLHELEDEFKKQLVVIKNLLGKAKKQKDTREKKEQEVAPLVEKMLQAQNIKEFQEKYMIAYNEYSNSDTNIAQMKTKLEKYIKDIKAPVFSLGAEEFMRHYSTYKNDSHPKNISSFGLNRKKEIIEKIAQLVEKEPEAPKGKPKEKTSAKKKPGEEIIKYLEDTIIPHLDTKRNDRAQEAVQRIERQIQRFKDKTITLDKFLSIKNQWLKWYDKTKTGKTVQEQLTKILAPYLMERIKNRKPIDNRLINMIKPRKSQKGKST